MSTTSKERRTYGALEVRCPACQSRPGQGCTQPTNTGRRTVAWWHTARTDRAQAVSNGWER